MEVFGKLISPIAPVTALVDRIDVNLNFKPITNNLKLSGFISWVGKHSSEITMKADYQTNETQWQTFLETKFISVGIDTINKSGFAQINPLEIVTEQDQFIFELGKSNFK